MRDDAAAALISPPPGGHLLSLDHKQAMFQQKKLLSLALFCMLVFKNLLTFLWYYHCNYLVITDRNFSSVMPSGWSAVGLVPEWELIIRSDEETHVPVMSEPAQLQVTSMLFNKSAPPTGSQTTSAHFRTWVIPCSSHFSHCVVRQRTNIPPKRLVRFFPLRDWSKRCNQEINSMPSIFQCRDRLFKDPGGCWME